MNNVQIPFELFADLTEYFFTADRSTLPDDLEARIHDGLMKKALAIVRREDYAERLRAKKQEQENS